MELHNQTSDLTIGNVNLFLRDPLGVGSLWVLSLRTFLCNLPRSVLRRPLLQARPTTAGVQVASAMA